MAYNSRLYGAWTFDPPLLASNLRDLPDTEWVKPRVTEDESQRGEEIIVRREARSIEVAQSGAWNYYTLTDELDKLLYSIPADRKVTGEFIRVGEDADDIERYRVVDSQLLTERARLSWPDGTHVTY